MSNISIDELHDFYSNVIAVKNNFKNKTNKQSVINHLYENTNGHRFLNKENVIFSPYVKGDDERTIPKFDRVKAETAYKFMKYVRDELNSYIFDNDSKRRVRANKPSYREPLFRKIMDGLNFVVSSNERVYSVPTFSYDGRISGKERRTVPAMRITLAHSSKIKQMLFSDTYSFNLLTKEKISDNKNFKDESKEVETYVSRVFPNLLKGRIDKGQIFRKAGEGQDEQFYESLSALTEIENMHDVNMKGLMLTQAFDDVVIYTTILQELYEELLLNMESRFKNLKLAGAQKELNEELKMFSQFCLRNSIFVDAFLNLSLKNHIFMDEMQLALLTKINIGHVPFLNNVKVKAGNEGDNFFKELIKTIKRNKPSLDEEGEYVGLIFALVTNMSTGTIPLHEMSNGYIEMRNFLKEEINTLSDTKGNLFSNKEDLEIVIKSMNNTLSTKCPLDVNKISDGNMSLLECLNDINTNIKRIDYDKKQRLSIAVNDLFKSSILVETEYLYYKYMKTIEYMLDKLPLDLQTRSGGGSFESETDDGFDEFYEKNKYVVLSKNIEIIYDEKIIKEQELVSLVEVMGLTINNYIEKNNLNLFKESREFHSGLASVSSINSNESIIGDGIGKITKDINEQFIEQLMRKNREKYLYDIMNDSNLDKEVRSPRKKV